MCLPSCYPTTLYLTGHKRFKASVSNPNKPPRRKRQSGNNLDYDEEGDIHVQWSVVRSTRKDRERQAQAQARWVQQRNDQAEMFENLETLKGLTKDEFRTMRKQNFFLLERTSTDGDFWKKEQ
jgi:hypothetical protein